MTAMRIISLYLLTLPLSAQFSEQEVRSRLDLIHSGKGADVRNEMPALMRQYPNDAGVKYLDAYLTSNGDQAVKKYQAIVDLFPKNEWADDALYKVYQYYYAVGLYKTADAKMNQLNERYPGSIYARRPVNVKEKTAIAVPPPPAPEETPRKETVTAEEEAVTATSSAVSPFVVQVGVYSQEQSAQQQARQLTSTVGRVAIVFAKMSAGKTVYAVAFGGFRSDTEARAFGAELKSKFNLDWFLVKR